MKKIKTLFKRNYNTDEIVRDEVVEGSGWVLNGEGFATRKFDGTCCLIREGRLYKRYDAKNGKTPSSGFIPAQDPDPITGHWPGWVEVSENDKWHLQGFRNTFPNGATDLDDGTYELLGPKIQKNPEQLNDHMLIKHGSLILEDAPRSYLGLMEYFQSKDIEGIVWHHPDGRMVKLRLKDFGIKRNAQD